jgi:hypothetical protein
MPPSVGLHRKQAEAFVRESEMGEQLHSVDLGESIECFDLDDENILDDSNERVP